MKSCLHEFSRLSFFAAKVEYYALRVTTPTHVRFLHLEFEAPEELGPAGR